MKLAKSTTFKGTTIIFIGLPDKRARLETRRYLTAKVVKRRIFRWMLRTPNPRLRKTITS